ncbi:Hypothetical protein R9X50_00801200 [Acrodontium crateriforme]|uniref:BTB domain-containing protein n=1 Tax=Acrodontium crateriforme TaxID=150365 RepID=A0AAQ3MDE0_9PEZI|nr:Hypothetical protein R9X50_00801200 [Acrodontium crateriforme]
MADRPRHELLTALRNLYISRDYSDLVIYAADGTRFPVHKAIICPRSPYFENTVKQHQWRDGKEGNIAVEEDDSEIVRLLIEYFYLLEYHPLAPPSPSISRSSQDSLSDTVSVRTEAGTYGHVYGTSAVSAFGGPAHSPQPSFPLYRDRADSALTVHALPSENFDSFGARSGARRQSSLCRMDHGAPGLSPLATVEPFLVLHARMYAAGDRYGVFGLKAFALDQFKIQLTRHWDSDEFPQAIHVVYNNTPSSDKDMREAVADVLGWYHRLLDKPEIEVAVMEINGLAYELLKRSRRAEPEYM